MNFSEVIKTLNNASAFDLFRMRAAIDRVLDEPRWMQSVQVRLKVGQEVEYFDPQANAPEMGPCLKCAESRPWCWIGTTPGAG